MLDLLKTFVPLFGMSMAFADGDGGSSDGSDSGGNSDVTDDELDDEGWIAKRGAKNLREELKRKNKDIEDAKALRAELEALKAVKPKEDIKPALPGVTLKRYQHIPHLKSFVDKYKGGVGAEQIQEYLEDIAELSIETSMGASDYKIGEKFKDINLTRLSKSQKRELERDMDDTLKTFEPKHKVVIEKFSKEIKEYIKKSFKPDDWDNPEIVKSAIGVIISEHPEIYSTTDDGGTSGQRKVNEGDNTSGGGSGSVSDEDLSEIYARGGLDPNNAADRKTARSIAIAEKKRDEAKNKIQ